MSKGGELLFWAQALAGYLAIFLGMTAAGWHVHHLLTGP